MSQDVDGSGLLSLMWAAWVYWCVYKWLDYSASSPNGLERQELSGGSDSIAPPNGGAGVLRLEAVVSEILRHDGAVTLEAFLADALAAYEMVVAAFDAGDLRTLGALVSAEVYEAFSGAIATRQEGVETPKTVFLRIDPPRIVDAMIDGAHMEITVRFDGETFGRSRDAGGEVAECGEGRSRSVDVWTFRRPRFPCHATWQVVATQG